MGLTPLEGVVMGTRSGDVDPAIIFYIGRELGMTNDEIDKAMNKKSGLLGLSGVSNDMRTVTEAAEAGNKRAALALQVFAYRVKKYIGAYMAVLGRTDAIVFTGGIGENAFHMRAMICEGLDGLGIELDTEKNKAIRAKEAVISKDDSPVKIVVVPTKEELIIARDTKRIAESLKK
jgi:acetate kinase